MRLAGALLLVGLTGALGQTSSQLNTELCRQLLARNISGTIVLQQLFENQQRQNSALYGTAVVTTLPGTDALTGEVSWRTSGAFGLASLSSSKRLMSLDTPVRLGGVSELLVVAAALMMPSIANNLNQAVNPQYMPNNLPLRNPSYGTQDITYKMLMWHTSSLIDTGYANFIRRPTCTTAGECGGESAVFFRTFIEQTFAPVTLGSQTLDPRIFGSQMPGAESSFQYAHINIALLAYVMDGMIRDGSETVQSLDKTVGSFIEERILHPLGMGSTFYLAQSGQVPLLTNQRLSQLENMKVREYDSSGTADARFVHSNYPADVMQFSSALDLGMRLAGALLAPPQSGDCEPAAICAAGRLMRSTTTTVTTNARTNQVSQGLGVVFYDPERICAETIASGLFSKCPLRSGHQVWGYVSAGSGTDRTSVAGVYCTDAASGSTARASCVSVLQAVRDSGSGTPTTPNANFAMAGAAFQTAFGESDTAVITSADDDDDLYGLWVFFGVVGTFVFVLCASYTTEFLIQPASATTGAKRQVVSQDPAMPGM